MPRALADIEDELVRSARKVLARLRAEFDALKLSEPHKARSLAHGFVNMRGELAPDGGPHRSSPAKFLLAARGHVRKFYPFLPYLQNSKRTFEIGVGTGYLFRQLADGFGVDMTGCDIEKTLLYRHIRDELGISDKVIIHEVKARQPLPLSDNTEAVTGFWTTFNRRWTVGDHQWLMDFCRANLVGEKLMVFLFNSAGFNDVPDVMDLYQRRGEFPLGQPSPHPAKTISAADNFCVLRL